MTPAPVGHHCPTCVAEGERESKRVRRRPLRARSVTSTILAMNVGVFVADALLGLVGRQDTLLEAGAMVPLLVAGGEWWRLLTAIFLHIGLLHLAFNSLALFVFGGLIEEALGSARMVAVYLVSGFAASATSYAFGSPLVAAVGASGAIFGMLGAWLAYNLRRRSLSLARSNVQSALFLIGINLVFGFTIPGIDNLAHIGGLVSGVAAGFAAEGFGRRTARTVSRIAGLGGITVIALILTVWRTSQLAQ